ncbi:hypothetical protein [Naasia aerilata]|uniref:hypothetical protein n=1 Tax=Naasia aerilata TaxID=1162966 RepID=UPI0025742811|nr:hypothetical protein [Naasia aerilata]
MTAAGAIRRPRLRRLPGTAFVLVNTVFVVVAMAISSATFWPIHRSEALVVAVAVALVAGVAIAIAGAARHWPAWAVGGLTILAYLVLGVPAAVPSLAFAGVVPTVPGLTALVAGAGLSWKELLTVSLPVGGYQTLLVPVFLLVLVLTVAGLSIALRARFGELAVLAPIALFTAGILLGPTRSTWPLPIALGLLVTLLLMLVWRRQSRRTAALDRLRAAPEDRGDRRRANLRRWLGAAVILVLAVGGSVAASAALPASTPRQVLRTAVEVPFDPRDYASPLSAFRRYFAEDRADRTMLTVDGLRAGSGSASPHSTPTTASPSRSAATASAARPPPSRASPRRWSPPCRAGAPSGSTSRSAAIAGCGCRTRAPCAPSTSGATARVASATPSTTTPRAVREQSWEASRRGIATRSTRSSPRLGTRTRSPLCSPERHPFRRSRSSRTSSTRPSRPTPLTPVRPARGSPPLSRGCARTATSATAEPASRSAAPGTPPSASPSC